MGHTEGDMLRHTEHKKDWQNNIKGFLLMLFIKPQEDNSTAFYKPHDAPVTL